MSYRPRLADAVLDRTSTVPLYAQLAQHIVHLIGSGAWPPGTAAPSVRQLAADLGLATATAQRVYTELQERGLLVGQPGRGVFVAELTPGSQPSEVERQTLLRDLLARPISQARSLGYGDDELVAAVSQLAVQPATTTGPPRVVFVGSSDASVQKYVQALTEVLAPLDVQIEGVQFADLARDEHLLDAFEPLRLLVALIGTFPDLRAVAARHGVPLFGLVVELSEETQHALIDLPSEGMIALVAQQRYLPSARALLRQYFIPVERIRYTTPTNTVTVRRLVQSSPVIAHTLGAARIVRELAPPSAHIVELAYRPNPASVSRLRDLLTAGRDGAQATSAQVTGSGVETAQLPAPLSLEAGRAGDSAPGKIADVVPAH